MPTQIDELLTRIANLEFEVLRLRERLEAHTHPIDVAHDYSAFGRHTMCDPSGSDRCYVFTTEPTND